MKKVFWLLSFLWLPSALYSCGWSPTYNQFSLFFHPISKGDKLYPFKYVSGQLFYNYNVEEYYYQHSYRADYKWNNLEWQSYLDLQTPIQDIDNFIYRYPYEHLKNLYYHIERGHRLIIPDSMKRNGLTKYFLMKKNYEVLGYLMYAKQCEQEHNKRRNIDKWDYESWTNRTADNETFKLIKQGTQLFRAAKSDWIKKRYAFQFIRLAHYYKEYKKANELYRQYVLPMNRGNALADYWLWGLRGGILRRLNKKEEAAVWFAKTVVRSRDKYLQAYNDFVHIGLSADDILPYCDTYLDSADVLFVSSLGKRQERVHYLEKLYTLQPDSRMLPLLMSRELAKLEQSYFPKIMLSSHFNDWSSSSYSSKKINSKAQGLDRLYQLVQRMQREGKFSDKKFLSNYSAYLAIAKGDYEDAAKSLQEENHVGASRIQAELLAWIIRFKQNARIDEQDLFSFLVRLDKIETSRQSVQSAKYHFLKYFVAPYFKKTGQIVRKAYALLKANIEEANWSDYGQENVKRSLIQSRSELSNFLAYQVSFDKLQKIFSYETSRQTDDPFVRYASEQLKRGFGVQNLANIIMRKYVRNLNWQEALAYYKLSMPERVKYEDPIIFRTKEQCGISFGQEKSDRLYTTKEVLLLAQDLKTKAKKNKATDLFNYGLLLYNLSYYGRLENLSVYDRRNYGIPAYTGLMDSIMYESNYYPIPAHQGLPHVPELDNYFNLSEAQIFFTKALKKSKIREEKAKCVFMLALCWQKTGDKQAGGMAKDYVSTSLRNPYFKIFKNDFVETPIYKRAFGTCSYLRMFAGR